MKRLTAFWLALCLLLGLSLGLWGWRAWERGRTEPSAPPVESSPNAPTLAFFGASTQPWCQDALAAAEEWCGQRGWALVEYDCLGLEATLALQVDDLAKSGGADLAVLCAVTGRESLEENALALKDQGLTLISLADRPLGPQEVPAWVRGQHLGPYSEHILDTAAAYFREELAPETGVVVLHDVETDPLEAAAVSALEDGGVRVAGVTYTWGSVDYAQALLGDLLGGREDIGGVLCFSRTGAQGARAALVGAGLADRVKVLCLDGGQELLDDLERGELDGVLTLAADDLAAELADALDRAAQGEALDRVSLAVEVRRPRGPNGPFAS